VRITSSLCAILFGLALPGCSTPPSAVQHDIPNFRPVLEHPGVYRGGQPRSLSAWAYLQSLGVSNVVKLNLESEASDHEARALGMTVTYYPIDALHQVLLKPDRTAVSNAVAAIKPGTYVHCKLGRDRTGLIVGCNRVWRDGWTKSNAWHEMLASGFRPRLRGLTDFWQDDVR
jgi:protein tyrosine/serine phosphatase